MGPLAVRRRCLRFGGSGSHFSICCSSHTRRSSDRQLNVGTQKFGVGELVSQMGVARRHVDRAVSHDLHEQIVAEHWPGFTSGPKRRATCRSSSSGSSRNICAAGCPSGAVFIWFAVAAAIRSWSPPGDARIATVRVMSAVRAREAEFNCDAWSKIPASPSRDDIRLGGFVHDVYEAPITGAFDRADALLAYRIFAAQRMYASGCTSDR